MDTVMLLLAHFGSGTSPKRCMILLQFEYWGSAIGMACADCLLLVRTYALWGNNKRLAIILGGLLAAGIPIAFYFWDLNVVLTDFTIPPLQGTGDTTSIPGCYATSSHHSSEILYFCMFGFETCVFVLTAYKGFKGRNHRISSLHTVIYRDGLLFYIYLLLISVANLTMFNAVHGLPHSALSGPYRIFHAVFAARLILNIRGAVDARQVETIPRMEFTPGPRSQRTQGSTFTDGSVTLVEDVSLAADVTELTKRETG